MTEHTPNTPKLRVRQAPKRGHYDDETIASILDASLVGHVSFVDDALPVSIPTALARIDDSIYLHGSRSSRMFKRLSAADFVCVSTCIVDGLVKARSGMHCSMNYRSVVVYGSPQVVSDEEKPDLLHEIVQKLIPGTEGDYRPHLGKELKATMLIRIPLNQCTAKIRAEGVIDDDEDLALPHWAGVIPIKRVIQAVEPCPSMAADADHPVAMLGQIQQMLD